jgi:ABC-type transporter Mla subunit MlaD
MRRLAGLFTALVAAIVVVGLTAAGPSSGDLSNYQVRAIFDNAAFAVPGEDVRIAGAPVGSIQSLDVTAGKLAAVTINIDSSAFTPFHGNATCAIRPQSLIGEKYVDCNPGSSSAPALTKINHGPGSGTYYLPVAQTSSPVDTDIVNNIYQEPIRQRFAIILNELGTGLAARGSDLNAVIHRANPALGKTNKVIGILARQNRQLAQLSTDSDTILTPLAKVKNSIADFVKQANTTSVASAQRAADISRGIALFPPFLRQLRPLLVDLGQLADQGTPLMSSLGRSAASVSRQFEELTPFARAARPALIALGKSSAESQPNLIATEPLARQLNRLGTQAVPSSTLLARLLGSLDQTGAIEYLMRVLFNGVSAANGFDSFGHYVRAEPLVGSCTAYKKKQVPGCSANFAKASKASAAAAGPKKSHVTAAEATIADLARQATASTPASASGGQERISSAPLTDLLKFLIGEHKP